MRRDIDALARTKFDLLIIGGGITGAWAAWDATLRGLVVALVERQDFAGATSANSLKIVHGGLRYLQQFDFPRMRASIAERSAVARAAPGLVRPLPFLIGTYGRTFRGRSAFRAAFRISEIAGFDRNRNLEPNAAFPPGRVLSRSDCEQLFPYFDPVGLTGGALWYDGQLLDTERLPLALLRSAAQQGAILANYVSAEDLLVRDGAVRGVRALDHVSGDELEIEARAVLTALGPWTAEFLRRAGVAAPAALADHGLAVNLVTARRFAELAVGLRAWREPRTDPVGGGSRYLFLVPWRRSTLIGTAYRPAGGGAGADGVNATEADLRSLIDECNRACPPLEMSLDDLTAFHSGLVPLRRRSGGRTGWRLEDADRVISAGDLGGPSGLNAAVGVKYTTARRLAQRALDLTFRSLREKDPGCRTAETPLDPTFASVIDPVAAGPAEAAQLLHSIREEMAVTLADFVFRRTSLGAEALPDRPTLERLADVMGAELGWGLREREAQVAAVLGTSARAGAVGTAG